MISFYFFPDHNQLSLAATPQIVELGPQWTAMETGCLRERYLSLCLQSLRFFHLQLTLSQLFTLLSNNAIILPAAPNISKHFQTFKDARMRDHVISLLIITFVHQVTDSFFLNVCTTPAPLHRWILSTLDACCWF